MKNDESEETAAKVEKTIQRLVASKSNTESKEVYAAWQSYDEDLDDYGYVAPKTAVDLLVKLLKNTDTKTNAHIYDAGCGSGKVGAYLTELGYQHLSGGDLSESMLERAAARNVYTKLSTANFSESIDEPDNYFDAAISVGVWNDAFGENLTSEMLRIVKQNGTVLFTVRPQFMDAAETQLELLLIDGAITNLQKQIGDYITGQNSEAYFISFQRM